MERIKDILDVRSLIGMAIIVSPRLPIVSKDAYGNEFDCHAIRVESKPNCLFVSGQLHRKIIDMFEESQKCIEEFFPPCGLGVK